MRKGKPGRIPTDIAGGPHRESQIRQDATKKALDIISEEVDARITGLDILFETPPEQRTESAQDKYLKEARFELVLVQELIKELRKRSSHDNQ